MGERRQGTVVQNDDGRLEYVVAGQDGGFRHSWQRLGASNDVGGWLAEMLGSAHPARPVVGWEPWAAVPGPEAGALRTAGTFHAGGRSRPLPQLADHPECRAWRVALA